MALLKSGPAPLGAKPASNRGWNALRTKKVPGQDSRQRRMRGAQAGFS